MKNYLAFFDPIEKNKQIESRIVTNLSDRTYPIPFTIAEYEKISNHGKIIMKCVHSKNGSCVFFVDAVIKKPYPCEGFIYDCMGYFKEN